MRLIWSMACHVVMGVTSMHALTALMWPRKAPDCVTTVLDLRPHLGCSKHLMWERHVVMYRQNLVSGMMWEY